MRHLPVCVVSKARHVYTWADIAKVWLMPYKSCMPFGIWMFCIQTSGVKLENVLQV